MMDQLRIYGQPPEKVQMAERDFPDGAWSVLFTEGNDVCGHWFRMGGDQVRSLRRELSVVSSREDASVRQMVGQMVEMIDGQWGGLVTPLSKRFLAGMEDRVIVTSRAVMRRYHHGRYDYGGGFGDVGGRFSRLGGVILIADPTEMFEEMKQAMPRDLTPGFKELQAYIEFWHNWVATNSVHELLHAAHNQFLGTFFAELGDHYFSGVVLRKLGYGPRTHDTDFSRHISDVFETLYRVPVIKHYVNEAFFGEQPDAATLLEEIAKGLISADIELWPYFFGPMCPRLERDEMYLRAKGIIDSLAKAATQETAESK